MINCTRFKIEKEQIAIEDDQRSYFIAEYRAGRFAVIPEAAAIAELGKSEFRKIEYRVRRFQYANLPPKFYLIREPDREAFEEMLDIASINFDALIDTKKREARIQGLKEGESLGILKGADQERGRIRSLSWWKRLFNKLGN